MQVAAVAVRRDAADVRLVNDAMEFAAATAAARGLEPAVLCVSQDTDFAEPLRYLSERGVRTVAVSPHDPRRRTHAAMEPGTYFRRLPLPNACWAALKWEPVVTPVTDSEASWLGEVIRSIPTQSNFDSGKVAGFNVPVKAAAAPTGAAAAAGSQRRRLSGTAMVTVAVAGAAAAERNAEVAARATPARALSSLSSSSSAAAAAPSSAVVEAAAAVTEEVVKGEIGLAAPAAMATVRTAEAKMDVNTTSDGDTKAVVRDDSHGNECIGVGSSFGGSVGSAPVTGIAAAVHPGLQAYTRAGASCPGKPTRLWLNPRYYM
ncbi:hypothetical protein Vafri_1866 [Volvox africanus]|nr:hypothetical protein Vafri_1866 [Volvox africanus]